MRLSKTARVNAAANRFLDLVYPLTDKGRDPCVWYLILAAFQLYSEDWPGQDIRKWQWPFDQVAETCPAFNGPLIKEQNQPWTVLLRRAMELIPREGL